MAAASAIHHTCSVQRCAFTIRYVCHIVFVDFYVSDEALRWFNGYLKKNRAIFSSIKINAFFACALNLRSIILGCIKTAILMFNEYTCSSKYSV